MLWLCSCNHGSPGEESTDPEEAAVNQNNQGDIYLTREQFNSMGMRIGDPSRESFSNMVNVNGFVVPTLSGIVKISPMISGRVKSIKHTLGENVTSGQVLFTMESNELIQLQQQYADAYHKLNLLRSNYDREKKLSEENVIAQKDFLKTESEYMSMLSETKGLRARLRMINIDPGPVEDGAVFEYLTVTSPIDGTITSMEMEPGEFIESQESVIEVVNTKELQLRLHIFEKDLADVAVGQQVLFYTPDNAEKKYAATLSHLGKSINPESRTISCLARIDPADHGMFVNNLFIEAVIYTCQRDAMAVPENSVIKELDGDFVLILLEEKNNNMVFRKIPVNTGVTSGSYTEVLDDGLKNVLLEGTYYFVTPE